jgi:hypothetical protein
LLFQLLLISNVISYYGLPNLGVRPLPSAGSPAGKCSSESVAVGSAGTRNVGVGGAEVCPLVVGKRVAAVVAVVCDEPSVTSNIQVENRKKIQGKLRAMKSEALS